MKFNISLFGISFLSDDDKMYMNRGGINRESYAAMQNTKIQVFTGDRSKSCQN